MPTVAYPALADLVLEGSSPADGEPLTVVVEASWRVDRHEVERAQARAGTLARIGRRAVAAVAGRSATPAAEEEAPRASVEVLISPGL
ncbi:MAG: hypothetical protein ACRD0L_13995 [Acidimicrobiales bacterium]